MGRRCCSSRSLTTPPGPYRARAAFRRPARPTIRTPVRSGLDARGCTMGQAITTTYGRTRYTATCERGRASVPNMTDRSIDENHRAALLALLEKFRAEDEARHGLGACCWTRGEWIGGGVGKGSTTVWVHNFANHPDEMVRFDEGPVFSALAETHGRLNDCLNTLDKLGKLGACQFDDGREVAARACVVLSREAGKVCHRKS